MSELPQIITKVWILQCDKLASLWKQYIWNDLSGIHIVDKVLKCHISQLHKSQQKEEKQGKCQS